MLSKRITLNALSLLVIAATVLAACAPPTPQVVKETSVVVQTQVVKETQVVEAVVTATPEPSKPEGTLTIGLTTTVTAIELPYAPERQSINASWTMFDALVYQAADGTIEPALAESWKVSDDGLEYTFKLRQGVKFHDGSEMTADSVVFSWNTYKQPEVTYGNYWAQVASVEKVDDYTVKLKTDKPDALLLRILATNWSIIPADWGGKTKEEFAEHPIGTGPFMFEEWVKGDHLTVVANPNYWRAGYPKLAKVVFKFMPEAATRVAAIQAGEIDISPRLSSELAQGLLGESGVQILKYLGTRIFYMSYNNVSTGIDTPIADPKVRQAIAHAVDVPTIINSLFDGYGVHSVGLVGQGELGFDNAEPPAYDPGLAKTMLADAGYPNGFSIDMACPDGGYTNINEVCLAIQGYLDEVGIKADLDLMEANAYWDLEAKQQLPPLFVDGWSSTLPEGYGRLKGSLGKGETYAAWYNPTLDDLINQVAVTVDQDARAKLYGEIQTIMREDPPFLYLYQINAFEAVRERVQNYQPRNAEDYFLWEVSVSDGQ
jgi:peptide/nickel transport system substrate-binding protein